MTALNTYRRWLARVEDDALRAELSALDEVRDAAQIEDRFYRDLAFGTGGLRGVLGAGTNRMNVYVVRRATQGLAAYLKAAGLPLRCAIAYDSRSGSARSARETARVLAANGVTAYLYPRLEPTPALSWAVRYYGCGAGVCVTASHTPAAYNGYKVYGPDGCQLTLEAADAVSKHIRAADHFDGVRLCSFADALADGTIRMIGEDCLEAFLDAVERRSVWDGDRSALRVVYTPLNGTGRECVTKILRRIGVTDVTLVPEQAWPDGSFPTCPYPNPEERAALEHGLALARNARRSAARHRPRLRPHGRGGARRRGLPPAHGQRDGRAAARLPLPPAERKRHDARASRGGDDHRFHRHGRRGRRALRR